MAAPLSITKLKITTMANWATTCYIIEAGASVKNELKAIIEKMLRGEGVKQEGSDPTWEGNVALALNESCNQKDYYLRGFVSEVNYDNKGNLNILADEAWSQTDFHKLLSKHYGEKIRVYWQCEEYNMGVYRTNDSEGKYFRDRFFVEVCIDNFNNSDYFTTKKDALDFVAMHTDCKTMEDIEYFNENRMKAHPDDFIVFEEYKIIKT